MRPSYHQQLLDTATDVLRTALPSQTGFTPTRLIRDGVPGTKLNHVPVQESVAAAAAAVTMKLAPPTTQIYATVGDHRSQSSTGGGAATRRKSASFGGGSAESALMDLQDSDARAVRAIHDAAMELANTHGSLRTAVTNLERIARQHEGDIDALQAAQGELSRELNRFSSILNASMINKMFAKLVRSARVGQRQLAHDMLARASGRFLQLYFSKWYRRVMVLKALSCLGRNNAMVLSRRLFRRWLVIGRTRRKATLRRIRVNAFRQLAIHSFRRWLSLVQLRWSLRATSEHLSQSTVLQMRKRSFRRWQGFIVMRREKRIKERLGRSLQLASSKALLQHKWKLWEKFVARRRRVRHHARIAGQAAKGPEQLLAGRYFLSWLHRLSLKKKMKSMLWNLETKNTLVSLGSRYFKKWEQNRLIRWVNRQVRLQILEVTQRADEATASAARAAEVVAALLAHQKVIEEQVLRLTEHKVSRELLRPEAFCLAPNKEPEPEIVVVREVSSEQPQRRAVSPIGPHQHQTGRHSPVRPKYPTQQTGSPDVQRRELPPYDITQPKRRLNTSAERYGVLQLSSSAGGGTSPPADSPPREPSFPSHHLAGHESSSSHHSSWNLSRAVVESASQRAVVEEKLNSSKWVHADSQLRFDALFTYGGRGQEMAAPKPIPALTQQVTSRRKGELTDASSRSVSAGSRQQVAPPQLSMKEIAAVYSGITTAPKKISEQQADVVSPTPARRRNLPA